MIPLRNPLPPWASWVVALVSLLIAVVALVVSNPPSQPEVVATPILTDTTMADLLRTPSPAPSPTPTPTPVATIRAPSGVGPVRITVAAPPPINVDYTDWYITQLAFPPAEQYRALRTSWCESTFDDAAVGDAGEIGRWQIHPIWWMPADARLDGREPDPGVIAIIESWFPGATGSVESTIAALHHEHVNAQVAAYIQGKNGWGPWTTQHGCPGWQG